MNKAELTAAIEKLGISKRKLATLLGYNTTYFSDLTKFSTPEEMPKHIVIIMRLLELAKENEIDFKTYLGDLDISKNKHKGGSFK